MEVSAYLQKNSEFSRPFVFSLTSRGFYSEINNLLNAMIFGLVTKRRLCVDQSGFAGGDLLWSDIFRSNLPWLDKSTEGVIDPQWLVSGGECESFHLIRNWINIWHTSKWQRARRFYFSRSCLLYHSVFSAKRFLARTFCRPITDYEPPASLREPYVAIHVRRGDKIEGYERAGALIVEGENNHLSDYLAILKRKSPHLRSLFVMTDDYQIVEKLREINSGLYISTLCQENEQDYAQIDFDLQGPKKKTLSIRKLISEIEIACNSQLFIGCYKSNVSRYIALTHRYPFRCYSVDSLKVWHPC